MVVNYVNKASWTARIEVALKAGKLLFAGEANVLLHAVQVKTTIWLDVVMLCTLPVKLIKRLFIKYEIGVDERKGFRYNNGLFPFFFHA